MKLLNSLSDEQLEKLLDLRRTLEIEQVKIFKRNARLRNFNYRRQLIAKGIIKRVS